MDTALLGAAGLQDCADAGMDCMPGFGAFLLVRVGGLAALLVWLAICLAVTVVIVGERSRIGGIRTAVFVLGLWLVPIVGLAVWIVYRRSTLKTTSSQDAMRG